MCAVLPQHPVLNVLLLATTSPISSFSTFRILLFGLPLFLFPRTSPYHLSLPSFIFIPNCSTLPVSLMYSFLILSFLVTHSTPQTFYLCNFHVFYFFLTTTVSSPYSIAGLTTDLYTFPFTLAGNLLSHIVSDTFFSPLHPACTLLFTSLSQLPLSCTIYPKYIISFTLGIFL